MQSDSFAAIARKRAETIHRLIHALEGMLEVYEQLMPGVKHISVKDYALLNEAPIEARAAIRQAKGE